MMHNISIRFVNMGKLLAIDRHFCSIVDGMDFFWHITTITLIAGVGGTGAGGVIGSLFRRSSNRVISLLLAATSGVMIAIVCFELLEESVAAGKQLYDSLGVILTAITVFAGVFVVLALNRIIDKRTADQVAHTASSEHPLVHDDIDELNHVDHYNEHARQGAAKKELWTAGVVIAFAIALHNIPEGMSIGASFAVDSPNAAMTALMLAVLIGLHNIPEGMAVTVPLVAGGMGRAKAVVLTACSGLPMVLGAWLGLWLGDIGPLGLCCSLGFASGAMLYVVFGEIIPQAILMYRSRIPAILVVVGMLVGMCLIYL